MELITLDVAIDLILPIPESESTDTVTYVIYDSAGATLAEGSMSFVADEMWKVNYTPDSEDLEVYDVIILKGTDSTIDSKRENIYQIIGAPATIPSLESTTSLIAICNMALSHIGAKAIASLAEDTPSADACNTHWLGCRNAVLREFNWPFARANIILAEVSSATHPEWDYVYGYPASCANVWNVFNEATYDKKEEQNFEVFYSASLNRKLIGSNLAEAYAEYTYKVQDTAIYDNQFSMALSYRLAAAMAHDLMSDPDLGIKMLNIYIALIAETKRVAAYEEKRKPTQTSATLDARG